VSPRRPHLTVGSARPRGFTLIELMIALATVTIVASVGYPGASIWIRHRRVALRR